MSGRAFGLAPVLAVALSLAGSTPQLPSGFSKFQDGPDGGTVWQGRIANREVPAAWRATVVYLPPHFTATHRYPVVYLLQGFRGSPYQFVFGLELARRADALIRADDVAPFIAVIPPAGLTSRFTGEWAGVWEDFLVRDVVPWADGNLPTIARRRDRIVAGLSAGGYGAVDIGLRHPGTFGTLESWSGDFTAPHDGSLAGAGPSELAAHDPSLLVRSEAPLLRRAHTRFFLSCGTGDRATTRATTAFARALTSLGIAHRVWLGPGGHDGRLWRRQLGVALRYALP